jgi:hypothetical protein
VELAKSNRRKIYRMTDPLLAIIATVLGFSDEKKPRKKKVKTLNEAIDEHFKEDKKSK